MKKGMIILALVAIGLVVSALPAGAYFQIKTHGNWTVNGTAGCADCHTTHAANAAFLLASGPTETDACFACHGQGATNSPYDVYDGVMSVDYNYGRSPRTQWTSGDMYPSYAGGFVKSYEFEDAVDGTVGHADGALTDLSNFANSQSVHNVETNAGGNANGTAQISGSTWNTGSNIPGGTNPIVGNQFKCGSCHDPHGGSNANLTARLLRKNLPGNTNDVIDFDTAGTVDTTTYRVTQYPDAINSWCGGCHNVFNTGDATGHNADGNMKYRHAMGIYVEQTSTIDTSIDKGTPLAKGTNDLICLSCHRAHGTAATVTGAASTFNRYASYNGTATGSGSVLLRLQNRDVCYNCHGAATVNTYTYYHVTHTGLPTH